MPVKHFESMELPKEITAIAPDGSNVRALLGLSGGSMAHFELESREVSIAIKHRSVEEIWYILKGNGSMWRKNDDSEEIIDLYAGKCLIIPVGTSFQFTCTSERPLEVLGITMPPWPQDKQEAVAVKGPWKATVESEYFDPF